MQSERLKVYMGEELRLALVVAVTSVLGCSGDVEPTSGGATGGASSASGGASSGSGGVPSGGGSGDTQPSGGTGSIDDGALPAASLLPLAVGNVWSYQFSSPGAQVQCEADLVAHVSRVVRTEVVDGRDAYLVTWPCASEDDPDTFVYVTQTDGEIQQRIGDSRYSTLPNPVIAGHSWEVVGVQYEWSFAGTMTVPAGTFENCWSRTPHLGFVAEVTYCPDVGPVRQGTRDYELALAGYELN
jgi:hypothetical protein